MTRSKRTPPVGPALVAAAPLEAPDEAPVQETPVAETPTAEDPSASRTEKLPDRPIAQRVASNAIPFCHQCGRTGEDDQAACPNLQVPGGACPAPVLPDADKDIVLHSAELGVIRTIPVAAIVRGKTQRYIPGFVRDDQWKVLHPKFQDKD